MPKSTLHVEVAFPPTHLASSNNLLFYDSATGSFGHQSSSPFQGRHIPGKPHGFGHYFKGKRIGVIFHGPQEHGPAL